MSDDKKIIFSMVGVSKDTPQGKQIIKNIHLSFFYGAKIGILGLNGSGKSTLLNILGLLDDPDGGSFVFNEIGGFNQSLKRKENKGGYFNVDNVKK